MDLVNGSTTTSSSLINREEQSTTMREQQSSTLREQQSSSSTTSSLVREEQRWSSSTDSEPAPGTSIHGCCTSPHLWSGPRLIDWMIEWLISRKFCWVVSKYFTNECLLSDPSRFQGSKRQGFGSGSGLDPYSIGPVDPDPYSESGSGSRFQEGKNDPQK